MKIIAMFLCGVFISGCASVPVSDLYTLDMRPSGRIDPAFGYVTVHVRVADMLARSEIAIKPSPTRVEFYALHKWAGDLGQLVNEKLMAEFGEVELKGAVPTAIVEGTLLAFEQVDTDSGADVHIKLSVEMEVTQSSSAPKRWDRKVYETTIPADAAEPGAVVLALSKGLESMAISIHEDMANMLD